MVVAILFNFPSGIVVFANNPCNLLRTVLTNLLAILLVVFTADHMLLILFLLGDDIAFIIVLSGDETRMIRVRLIINGGVSTRADSIFSVLCLRKLECPFNRIRCGILSSLISMSEDHNITFESSHLCSGLYRAPEPPAGSGSARSATMIALPAASQHMVLFAAVCAETT